MWTRLSLFLLGTGRVRLQTMVDVGPEFPAAAKQVERTNGFQRLRQFIGTAGHRGCGLAVIGASLASVSRFIFPSLLSTPDHTGVLRAQGPLHRCRQFHSPWVSRWSGFGKPAIPLSTPVYRPPSGMVSQEGLEICRMATG